MEITRFAYCSIEIMHGSEQHELALCALGRVGWELVSVVNAGMAHVAYLKRPLGVAEMKPDRDIQP